MVSEKTEGQREGFVSSDSDMEGHKEAWAEEWQSLTNISYLAELRIHGGGARAEAGRGSC